jgi:cytochrome c-type biogenesis protein CcmH/NrfG
MLHMERSELREALQSFERYVTEEPMDDSGWALLGLAAFGAGDAARAEAAMSRAIQLAPDAPNYHVALGGFLLARPQDDAVLDRAIAELRAAVRLGPEEWLGHYRLATALMRRQDLASAAAELEEAARLNPAAKEPCVALPPVLRRLGDAQGAARYQRLAESLTAREGQPGAGGRERRAAP